MLGLKRGTVKLAEAHEEWARLFEIEKELLKKRFGDSILAIEHVGSTSIPDIPAKPILDMNVAVSSLEDEYIREFVAPLEKLGYHYMHKFPDRHFFAKGPEALRTHHLNLVTQDSDEWQNSLLFRNFMRRNNLARDEYAALKQKLAVQFADERTSYTKAKEEFIQSIIRQVKEGNRFR